MYEPTWKRVVEGLKAEGFESRYLDRLYERISPAAIALARRGIHSLQREIIDEMAYALCRTEDKVNFAMLQVEVAARDLDRNTDESRREELEQAYEECRRKAMRARWEFQVHREAIGLIKHDVLETLYPMPPSLRRRQAAAE